MPAQLLLQTLLHQRSFDLAIWDTPAMLPQLASQIDY